MNNFVIPQTIGDDHTLWAGLMDIHPGNGNRYYGVCSQHSGSDQDFVVYRRKPGREEFEYVAKLDGKGFDAVAFVTAGMGKIRPDGALEIVASGQPVGVTDNSGTGFDGFGAVVPNVDDPWALVVPYVRVKQPAPVKMNPPVGFEPYGGANVDYEPSADGAHFFAQCGKGPQGFGQYVMRQEGTNRGVLIDYRHNGTVLDALNGRGELLVGGDGWLYITGTESDTDKATQAYIVDGYVPFARNIVMYGGGATSTGGGDTAALELKIAALTQQVQTAQALATAAMQRANYVKGIYEPVWTTLEELENRPVGISRDEGWQLAKDAVYGDLGDAKSGNYARVRDIARQLVGTAAGGIDQVARDVANEALKQAADIKNNYLPLYSGPNQVRVIAAQEAVGVLDRWLAASKAYTDTRLFNLIWDRGVKLARFLKVPGADKAPINDEANLKV